MKRIFCLCVILLCSISIIFAQGGSGRTNTKKPVIKKKVNSELVKAEKDWSPFWDNFKATLRKHDKNSFKELISKNYQCYCEGECAESNFHDKRDSFFCIAQNWDGWWKGIDWVLGKEIREVRIEKIKKEGVKITRTVEEVNLEASPTAIFDYQNGKWYLLAYIDAHGE